jgi:hypothetical protein
MTRRRAAAIAGRAAEDELFIQLGTAAPVRVHEPEEDEDWDEQVRWALEDRQARKWLRNGAGELEHPTARFLRIGISSIRAGKPSGLFIEFLEVLALRAERRDVLRFIDPRWLPVKSRSRDLQLQNEEIAKKFVDHLRAYQFKKAGKPQSVEEAKRQFKKRSVYHEKTIDRALAAQGLSVPSRRKRT